MTQVVSNRTGRERIITAEGENTEFIIEVKKQKNLLRIRSKSKFNADHNFKENDKIFLQAYESGGIAKEPWSLGTIGKTGEFEFTINDISFDTLMFRLKDIDENNFVKGFADEIRPNLESSGKNKTTKDSEISNTLLPIRETDKISLPFAVDMSPDSKPILLVKSKLNLKEQFKHDIKTKVFIYTSVIKQILTIYLSDNNFKNCTQRKRFIDKVISNTGTDPDLVDIPNYFDENQNINQDALEWIDSITSECLNNPVEFKGKKINYISVFEKQCREQNFEDDDED